MLDREEVIKIAKLSKLDFNDKELDKMNVELNKIFEYIEELNELDTENVIPLFNVLDLEDVTRKDESTEKNIKKELLENAPQKDSNFIIVPNIIGE